MAQTPAQVYLIDDEPAVQVAFERLFRSAGLTASTFGSFDEFLTARPRTDNACLILDVRMPDRSGLEVPALLEQEGLRMPVIFVTAYDTPETRSAAKAVGAAGYFRKPVDDQALLDAIDWALSRGDRDGDGPDEERGQS